MRLNGQSFTYKKNFQIKFRFVLHVFWEHFFIIICKISLFVVAANREAILLVTYAGSTSLKGE